MREERRLSLQEAAGELGISEVTARRWVKSGKLRASQPGRRYLIPGSAVEELLEGVSPRAKGWFEPENAAELESELRGHGFDLLAMDADEFEGYLDGGRDLREMPKRVLEEWAQVHADGALRHLAVFANHRGASHLNAIDHRAEEARGAVEEARAALA